MNVNVAKEAAHMYQDRQRRIVNPKGEFDKAGRWFPADSEKRSCCDDIRGPSRRYPYSLIVHCRTKKHIANLHNITIKQLNQALKEVD